MGLAKLWRFGVIVTGVLAWTRAPGALGAPDDAPVAWLTGAALETKLAQPENLFWQSAPLRESLRKFSRLQRVAVLIDRRLDPGEEINLTLKRQPILQILRQIGHARDSGFSMVGPVAYFGPPETTSRLPTVAELRREEARKLAPEVRGEFFQSVRMSWDDFAAPRELLGQLARQSQIEISGLDRVPHDLWAAADLPPLPLVDRITLVAAQFDLTFETAPDGNSVRLVSIPDEVAIARSYPGGRQPEQLAALWSTLAPDSQIKVVGGTIFVKGLLEDHQRIAAGGREPSLRVSPPLASVESERPYTATVKNKPLGEVLQYFAYQLQLELRIDRTGLEKAGVSLEQLVSFTVKSATLDELFEAMLTPVGCTYRRHGSVVEILPAT